MVLLLAKYTMSRNILLCVSGGIAAYKTVELVRLWVKSGYQVKVIVTDNAQHYVAVSALEVVCGGMVYTNASHIIDGKITHTYLAKWADIIVVAPATANVVAKLAHGFADDLLLMTILATNKSIYIAPAMNIQMYENVATREAYLIGDIISLPLTMASKHVVISGMVGCLNLKRLCNIYRFVLSGIRL